MSLRTLSIGGATYDLFLKTDAASLSIADREMRLPLGSKVRVDDVIETCGGGASNTSVGLKRLGLDAGFCGVVGNDQWGQKLLENLQKEGVDTSTVTVVEKEMTSFSLILSITSGDRIIFNNSGVNAHMHDAIFDKAAAATADWVYLNRMHEQSCIIEDDIVELLDQGSAPGLTWNPGGCHIDRGIKEKSNQHLLSHTDILLVNKEEALAFTQSMTPEDALQKILQTGVRMCIITDGKNGSVASDGKHLYRCPVLECEVIDTTGAGDAFGVGATWAFLKGFDLPTMLRGGTINSTSVLQSIGAEAGLLTETEMQHQLNSLHLTVDMTPLP